MVLMISIVFPLIMAIDGTVWLKFKWLIFRKTLFYSFLCRVHVFGGQQTKSGVKQFLPNLESLTIDGDVSLCLIESLLTSVAKLKALTIYIHRSGH